MNGRSALVTGAAHGIGQAIATRLAEEGHRVHAVDVDAEALEELAGGVPGVVPMAFDVADAAAIAELTALLPDPLDVVVNNAGIGTRKPFYDMSDQDWDGVLDLDLHGPFRVTRACWPVLRKPGGAVVNITSIHGSRPLPGGAAYAAAKGGLENLTRAMALDAAPHGVRVNAVAPGFIRTRAWLADIEDEGERAARDEAARRRMPEGRPGEPEEVAAAVAWLAGPQAGYVNGAVLAVDGALAAQAYPTIETR